MTCGYEGSHFGAHYPDAACIDGYLWDLDSCDEPGGPLYRGGGIGCPCCNTREHIEYHDVRLSGNAMQRRKQMRALVRDTKARAIRSMS
jgi:uncharacterized Zn finger protein (UPF0148 family)